MARAFSGFRIPAFLPNLPIKIVVPIAIGIPSNRGYLGFDSLKLEFKLCYKWRSLDFFNPIFLFYLPYSAYQKDVKNTNKKCLTNQFLYLHSRYCKITSSVRFTIFQLEYKDFRLFCNFQIK